MSVRDHKNIEGVTPVLRKCNDLVLVEMTGHTQNIRNRGAVSWKDIVMGKAQSKIWVKILALLGLTHFSLYLLGSIICQVK